MILSVLVTLLIRFPRLGNAVTGPYGRAPSEFVTKSDRLERVVRSIRAALMFVSTPSEEFDSITIDGESALQDGRMVQLRNSSSSFSL